MNRLDYAWFLLICRILGVEIINVAKAVKAKVKP